MLARGLLGVFDISLCDEARVPRSSAGVRRVFIHDIMEVEGVKQQDRRDDDEGEEVNGGVEDIKNNTHTLVA